jgi:hypothetical protein
MRTQLSEYRPHLKQNFVMGLWTARVSQVLNGDLSRAKLVFVNELSTNKLKWSERNTSVPKKFACMTDSGQWLYSYLTTKYATSQQNTNANMAAVCKNTDKETQILQEL